MPQYVVLQVTLKEKFIGTSSKNLNELEDVINTQAAKGYRLHTISTTSAQGLAEEIGFRPQWYLKNCNKEKSRQKVINITRKLMKRGKGEQPF